MSAVECECRFWARTQVAGEWRSLFTGHHPACRWYNLNAEVREVLGNLTRAVEGWAADEDGLPEEAYPAYVAAKTLLGEPVTPAPLPPECEFCGKPVTKGRADYCADAGLRVSCLWSKCSQQGTPPA
jgi:hypothetical protein